MISARLTCFVLADLHLGRVGWWRGSSFVHGDNAELIFPSLLQIRYLALKLITRNLDRLLPIGLVPILLLDYIFLDRRTSVEVRRRPFQAHGLVVVIGDLGCSGLQRLI